MRRLVPFVIGPLLMIACGDSPTADEPEAPPPEAMLSAFASLSVGPEGTYPCPDGGEIERTGETNTVIGEGAITTTWHMTMVHRGCAVRFDQLVLTTDGTISLDGIDRHEYDGFNLGGLIESTVREVGSLRWRTSDGYDRTCAIDLTIEADPATNARRMHGLLCGDPVDFEVTLTGITNRA